MAFVDDDPPVPPRPEPRFTRKTRTIYTLDIKKLKPAERRVVNLLAEAYNEFVKLPFQHPSNLDEFVTAIHVCQRTVGIRAVRKP